MRLAPTKCKPIPVFRSRFWAGFAQTSENHAQSLELMHYARPACFHRAARRARVQKEQGRPRALKSCQVRARTLPRP